jgi:aminoglycoside N3'-acetyltransferase
MSLARPPRSVADVVQDLRDLGVAPADMLMVHASLRAIGPVEGGADGVLDALGAAVGPDGTLLMILGAEIAQDWVNQRPETERPALLRDAPPFDPQTAPVFHEVGTLAEVFRRRPGTIVTANPCGRFGARGGNAEALLKDAPWDDYYGPGSPLERFCELGGFILRLGAGLDTTTVLHLAEYLADIPNKRRVRRHYRCMTAAGPATCAVECLDDENGIVAWEGEDYFAIILREYIATGRAKQGLVGNAHSERIEAADLVRFGARWMSETLV